MGEKVSYKPVGAAILVMLTVSALRGTVLAAHESHSSDLWGRSGERWTPQSRLPDFSYARTQPPNLHEAQLARPLAVHPTNPRFFVDRKGKVIYLGGHQVFTDIQDNAWTKPWVLDWPRHMEFMKEWNLNYLRNWIIFSTGGGPNNVASPMPYARTGPGTALDGQPKFDLQRFDETYFKRLHDRVRLAQDQSIVVSIMLFEVYGFNANVKDKAYRLCNTRGG